MLARQAKLLRAAGHDVWTKEDLKGLTFWERVNFQEACTLMWRPYDFLPPNPSDALIFIGLDSFGLVMAKWGFGYINTGLSFIALLVGKIHQNGPACEILADHRDRYVLGYFIAYAAHLWDYKVQRAIMKGDADKMSPERRLKLLLYLIILEPIGLFGFAFTSFGPPAVHWIAPLVFVSMIGIANFSIYMATIDYMVAAYGPYSASATGGNGFCRDFLAGISALFARPLYTSILPGTKWQLAVPSLILSAVGVLVAIPVFYFYVRGEEVRDKSEWAKGLSDERRQRKEEREEAISTSRSQSARTTPVQSRRNSEEMAQDPDVERNTALNTGSMKGDGVVDVRESAELRRTSDLA
ncbi:hypothetical protein LTS10_005775 [Elasticomyces elasticus]|nr:hypothetical protein LTS10_005775 [Elasticomyces elasticus]